MRPRVFTRSVLIAAAVLASAGVKAGFAALRYSGYESTRDNTPPCPIISVISSAPICDDKETSSHRRPSNSTQLMLAGDSRSPPDHPGAEPDSSGIEHPHPGVVEQVQKLLEQSTVPGESLQELARQTMEAFSQGPKIIIRSSDIPVNLRGVEYKGLLGEFVDFDSMGRLVLGEYHSQLSPAQFNEFVGLYKEFLLTRQVFGSIDTWDGAVEIAGLTPVGMHGFIVTFNLDSSKLGKAQLDFYIHKSNSGFPFKIADVIAQGISLIKTQRADFAAIIKTQGLQGLNQTLVRRTQDRAGP